MTVAYFREFSSGIDPSLSQQVNQYIMQQIGGKTPEGAIFHAEGPTDAGGYWAFDLWSSEESAERFYTGVVNPAFQKFNIPDAPPRKLAVQFDTSRMPGGM